MKTAYFQENAERALGSPSIVMMKAAEDGKGDDPAHLANWPTSSRFRFWDTLINALMRPRPVEVRHILLEHAPQMSFTHDEQVIEAFASNAPQQPLANGIRPRCFDWGSQHLDPTSPCDGLEVRAILRIIISDQIRWRDAVGCGLAQLLSTPDICR